MIFNKGVGYFLSLEAVGGGAKGVTTQNKNEVKENIFFDPGKSKRYLIISRLNGSKTLLNVSVQN
jgi:hypothetical protein